MSTPAAMQEPADVSIFTDPLAEPTQRVSARFIAILALANLGIWTASFTLVQFLLPLQVEGLVGSGTRPQENGNRTQVRWLEAFGDELVLRVEDLTGEHLGFTAWPWTQEALDAAEHDHDLVAGREVTLNVDRRQRGVGGDLPGVVALLPAYTIPAGQRHEVSMRLSVRTS
ncbi:MAG: hypothetical protein WCF36_09835 [Candidatus Nanopelagicales bacterium]